MLVAYSLVLTTALLLAQFLFGFYQIIKPKGVDTLGRRLVSRLEFSSSDLGGPIVTKLAITSFASMFLELMMIRWISSEIRIFAFFKNFVLVACFFGFGMGCHFSKKKINLLTFIAPLVYLVALMKLPWAQLRSLVATLPNMLGVSSDLRISNILSADWLLVILALSLAAPLFVMITFLFVPYGQLVGWYLENSSKGLAAYTINVGASILGILGFTVASFLNTAPAAWLLVLGVFLMGLFWKRTRFSLGCIAGVLICVGFAMIAPKNGSTTYWSPYQKLTLTPVRENGELTSYELNTNDSWYQHIVNLSAEFINAHSDRFRGKSIAWNPYNLPYRFYGSPSTVLVLGAGMGNDVAAAVRNTDARIVAVEIDPTIVRLGKALHFEKPYDSPRVRVAVDDARSYLHNCREQFDLILFSLLDSHTTNSNYTNIRIDNYVYTVQGLREARNLVKPDGLVIVKFDGSTPWITGRLDSLMTQVFGQPPLKMESERGFTPSGQFFIAGSKNRIEKALRDPEVASYVSGHQEFQSIDARATDDDWPYFYQREPGIPLNVILLSALVVLLSFWFVKRTGICNLRLEWHFFFLGAGFLLFEVQIVSKLALLFGTTWLVNAFVISALLLFIMAANWTIQKFPHLSTSPAYAGILVSGLLAYFVPVDKYFFESVVLRALCALAILCSPAYFAGIIFAKSYATSRFSSHALGSNILGALCGGIVESLSLWTGIRSLVLIALIFYFFSALFIKERLVTTKAAST